MIEEQMIEVESSMIKSVGYDSSNRVLFVQFKNKSVYQYHKVQPEDYEDLMGADSVGKFFNSHIKDDFACGKTTFE